VEGKDVTPKRFLNAIAKCSRKNRINNFNEVIATLFRKFELDPNLVSSRQCSECRAIEECLQNDCKAILKESQFYCRDVERATV
jgi:hypothetical protein